MPHSLDIKNSNKNIKIDTDSAILATETTCFEFIASLERLHNKSDLESFKVDRNGAVPNDLTMECKAKDGRVWNQRIKDNATDPVFNYDTPDFWKLSEDMLIQPMRDNLLKLNQRYGVIKIRVNYL